MLRAIVLDADRGPQRLQLMDAPIPEIGADNMLISVQEAGVKSAEISLREGCLA